MRRLTATVALAALLAMGGAAPSAAAQIPTDPTPAPPVDTRPTSAAEAIARQYVDAYSAADWDAMEPLMSDDFVFVDRTSPDLANHEFQGRDAALTMFRDFGRRGRIVGLFLDFPVVFESQGVAVFSGSVNALSRAPEPGYGLRWSAEQVIILTVRDGRVVRHEDYANYTAPLITRERLEAGQ